MAAPSGRKPDAKASSGKGAAVDRKSGPRPAVGKSGKTDAIRDTAEVPARSPSGKTAATKAPSGKTAAAKATSSRKVAPMPTGGGTRPSGPVWVTCRECSEEWTVDLDKAQRADTLTCPICEHRAEPPSDDILHQIALYKGIESRNLHMAVFFFCLGLSSMVAWTFVTLDPVRAQDGVGFMTPIAVGVFGLIGALYFTSKYENSRWETYF